VNNSGDADFWTSHGLKRDAVYLGKMATSLARKGDNLGLLMLQWTQDWAARHGAEVVRWDVWKTNERLQQYYKQAGANYLRTVEATGRWSGALFELQAQEIPSVRDRLLTVE
jgi:hypothetical protein